MSASSRFNILTIHNASCILTSLTPPKTHTPSPHRPSRPSRHAPNPHLVHHQGTSQRTQQELEVAVENMGGHLNAYTSREQTVYFARVHKSDVPSAVGILGDILQNSLLSEDAITRERDVILREMEEVEKQHEEVIFDHLHETAFQGTGLGRTILGPRDNIRSLTRDDLAEYISTHYTGPRMVLAGAGGIDHNQLVALGQEHFGNVPQEPAGGLIVPFDQARFTGSDIRVRDDSMPTAHMAIAFESFDWTSEHAFPLMVMQTLLGAWSRTDGAGPNMSSKLCQAVAERDLAHSVMTFNTSYKVRPQERDRGDRGGYGSCSNEGNAGSNRG